MIKNTVQRVAHAVLITLSIFPWLIGIFCVTLAALLVILADRIWPRANWGNCWAYVTPRWVKHGGYLVIRWADNISFLRRLRIPHAFWITKLGTDNEIRQTIPINRSSSKWFPWRVFYFPYKVIKRENPHDSDWTKLDEEKRKPKTHRK